MFPKACRASSIRSSLASSCCAPVRAGLSSGHGGMPRSLVSFSSWQVPIGPVALTDFVSVVFVFPLIIAVAARASAHRRLDALWRRLGRLSYPLYMVHFPCVVVLSNLAHRRGVTGWRLEASAVLCFLAVVAFAGAVEVIYDEPARRALKSVLARKRDGHEAASPAHAPHPHLSGSRAVPVET